VSKPRRLPDQDARDRIEHEIDQNFLVEASAGSGKTESLARRMAAGIAAGTYRVEGIAAVTFTRKAAAELRGRFQLELERRLGMEPDARRKENIRTALSQLERLFAGTIHAFCAHLLRERPVEAGVAPGFAEQDDIEDLEFRMRAWRDFLDGERAKASPGLHELDNAGVQPRYLDAVFGKVCTFADVVFPPGDGKAPDPRPAWKEVERFWKSLTALLPPFDPATTCKVQRTAREFRRRLNVANRDRMPVLVELLECWESAPWVTQKWWPGTPQQRKAMQARIEGLIDDFRQKTALPFLSAWRQYVYRLAMMLLIGGREFAAEARRRAVTLNYTDLLMVAARLLRDNPAVRTALQRKYRWLFVDEFQDTNPLQAEAILLLSAYESAERNWTKVSPRPGALFVVGDPKQSIYRFNGADIDTYSRVRAVIERTSGRVVNLTTSFRSVPVLCTWANDMFKNPSFFPAKPTVEQPVFHPLQAERPAGSVRSTGLRTLTAGAAVDGKDVVATDANAIARFIRASVDRGERKWRDFLVLTWKKKSLGVYAAALDALRIPVAVSGAVAFSESREVRILAGLLRVLADPDDGVALVGVLRDALYGISDEDLFRHRQAGFGFLLNAPLPDTATGPVVDALRELQGMFRWTRLLPAPAAIERILEATGLLARAAATTPGGGEAGDLLHAVDRVRQITETGGTLADAADALANDLEGSEIESVPLEPGRQDVVRVMNLHKAKGLEAAVVFLADPTGGYKRRADLRVIRDGPEPLGYFRITRPFGRGEKTVGEPPGWEDHESAELRYVEAEEKRLLYVAATRARDLLVVSRWAKPTGVGTRPWRLFDPALASAQELPIPATVTVPVQNLGDLGPDARNSAMAAREGRRDVACRASWAVESVTATAHHGGGYGHPLQEGQTREPDTGMVWGTLIHALLENAMRGPVRDRAHLQRLANWLAVDNPELRRVVGEAVDTVERVMASEFWGRAMAAEERQVEVPFAVRSESADGPPRLIYGVIDLAFKSQDGWHLIDYKTDMMTLDNLGRRYGDQVLQYAKHWRCLTGEPVSYAGLFGVRDNALSVNVDGG
jgi:ATP-dependent helicase/nuclease subunit A